MNKGTLRPRCNLDACRAGRLLFRWLVDCNWMSENPTAHLRFMRKSGTPQPLALRRREVFALFHAAAASPHRLALRNVALVQLMVQAGLRVGEVTALTHAESDTEHPGGTVHVRDGKGHKARDIPLNATVRRAVQAYLATQPTPAAGAPVFRSKRGTALAVRSAQAVVARLAHRLTSGVCRCQPRPCGIPSPSLSPAPSRQTAGARRPLGARSLETTAVYTKPLQDDVAADLERSPLNVFRLCASSAPGVLQHTAPRPAVFISPHPSDEELAFNWTLSERDIDFILRTTEGPRTSAA